ncbi:phospholipase D-like domain-containing protein [Spirillospora sp. CA-294931]|uniref:phospholipase D-like domain-containing protein n=1 Tax=Spirillospora sp. CA-294931 TaxID=3240042 RepID=UPI003D8F5D74
MRLTRTRAVTVAGAAALVTAIALADASAAPPSLVSDAYFNIPGTGTENELVDHLVKLIDGAEENSVIMGTAYVFDDARVTKALVGAAKDRDVKVQIITDANAVGTPEYQKLEEGLKGQDGSWVKGCPPSDNFTETSCQGSGSMHNKFFLFSHTKDEKAVVSTSSANLGAGSVSGTYNSTYTDVGNVALYTRFERYFQALRAARTNLSYYQDNPPESTGNTKSYFYPRADDPKGNADTVVNTLDEVKCPGTIRVGMWSISRTAAAKALRAKATEGCQIEIVADRMYDGACDALLSGGTGRDRVAIYGFRDGVYIHQKNIMIDATYTGEKHKVVFTGSANLNTPSLRHNDENVIRIQDHASVYTKFVVNFDYLRDAADFKVRSPDECKELM